MPSPFPATNRILTPPSMSPMMNMIQSGMTDLGFANLPAPLPNMPPPGRIPLTVLREMFRAAQQANPAFAQQGAPAVESAPMVEEPDLPPGGEMSEAEALSIQEAAMGDRARSQQAEIKSATPKQEQAQFRQQVNAKAVKGDQGGDGAKKTFAKPIKDEAKPQPQGALDKDAYTIQRGDSLSVLAWKNGTTVKDLMRWNNIQDPNFIRAGDKIRLREPQAETAVAEAPEVEQGETPLARKIREANAKGNPSAFEAVSNINYGNPYNQSIRDAAGTAGSFAANAAAMPVMWMNALNNMRRMAEMNRLRQAEGAAFQNPFQFNPRNVTR